MNEDLTIGTNRRPTKARKLIIGGLLGLSVFAAAAIAVLPSQGSGYGDNGSVGYDPGSYDPGYDPGSYDPGYDPGSSGSGVDPGEAISTELGNHIVYP
ncbi:MAG: hypothetical protein ACR2HV_09880 [Acidimicrobiales bacterium]